MVSFSSCNTRQESTKTYLQKCILTDLAFKSLIYSLLEELKWKYKLLKKTNDRTDGRLVWKPEKLSRTLDLPEFSLIKKERFLPITLPSVIFSEELQQWDLFEHVNRYLKMHVWREREKFAQFTEALRPFMARLSVKHTGRIQRGRRERGFTGRLRVRSRSWIPRDFWLSRSVCWHSLTPLTFSLTPYQNVFLSHTPLTLAPLLFPPPYTWSWFSCSTLWSHLIRGCP